MIRIAIVMLVLLMGCGSLKSEFPRCYYGMEGKNFHKDYPNLKLLGHDIYGGGPNVSHARWQNHEGSSQTGKNLESDSKATNTKGIGLLQRSRDNRMNY